MPLTGEHPPLIVILGPTAIGKTGLGIRLAQHFDGEIVGADSRQIYRHMDIGTAKPTPQEQAQAVHHLIDVVNPDENMTLAEYQARAYACIDAIHARDKLPLLVGGTGQYITAVVEGWSIPRVPPNPTLRAELEQYAHDKGNEALYQRLQTADPQAAAKIHPNNIRRMVRALEVYIETGTPISILQQHQPPPYTIYVMGLQMAREPLYERADNRVEQMMASGFLDEVRHLLASGYDRTLPAMSALGYAELAAYLNDEIPYNEAVYKTKMNTHDFIRRQEIWFRGHDHDIRWYDATDLPVEYLIETLQEWLAQA